ncbi:hypothetical protein P3S67_025494 [Capsicum chacoense]
MDGSSVAAAARSKNPTTTPSRNHPTTAVKNHRRVAAVDDPIECTGKFCMSCTAGVVADCVALCCCPCAVIDILALAFLKMPWTMVRKCFGKGKKMGKKKKEKERSYSYRDCVTYDLDSIDGRISTRSVIDEDIIITANEKESLGIVIAEQDKNNITSNKFDNAEEFWLDLYEQVGHLGFGRVSYTGIPTQGNSG